MTLNKFDNTDGMETPVMNRAGIMGVLKVEFSRARRYECPLSAVLIQIDRFENLRDLYGMEIADQISDQVIRMINSNTRLSDFLGKLGERFLLIMPHTDAKGALVTVNRIRKKLTSLDFDVSGKRIKVTLSIGISDNAEEESIFYDSIYKRTESALKNIISQGGDGVEIHNPTLE